MTSENSRQDSGPMASADLQAHMDVLGVEAEVGTDALRAAYLAKIREFPPDRFPEQFERIRDAYRLLGDPRRRVGLLLEVGGPDEPFTSLLAGTKVEERRRVGPDPWMAVLRGKRSRS